MSEQTVIVYLAGRYSRHAELEGYARTLRALGFTVSSRWHSGAHELEETDADVEIDKRRFAEEDLVDLADAGILVSFTDGPDVDGASRGGRHVEFGMALAIGARLLVVGPRENVFHWLPFVWQFDEWESARFMIEGIAASSGLRSLGEWVNRQEDPAE